MTVDTAGLVKAIELAMEKPLFERKGIAGITYRIVREAEAFRVLIVREGTAPVLGRKKRTLAQAKLVIDDLELMAQTLARVGKRK